MNSSSTHIVDAPPVRVVSGLFDLLSLTGTDVIDFLQRISTNDMILQEGAAVPTLLVTDKGRILDTVWVMFYEHGYAMAVSRGMASGVRQFLERYIIMDDVSVNDISGQCSVLLSFAPDAQGETTRYFGHDATLEVIAPAALTADHPTVDGAFEEWRIRNGIPRSGKEMIEAFNPLELNLWDFISFTKGCYIGQEVIARLDTYKKVSKTLCFWRSDNILDEGTVLQDESGTDAGRLTSALRDGAGSLGLCVVRNRIAVPGTSVPIGPSNKHITIERVFSKGVHGRD